MVVGDTQLLEDIEATEEDDSENKQIDDLFATAVSSSDERSNASHESEAFNEEYASSSRSPFENEHIEVDEGSGSEPLIESSTEVSKRPSSEANVVVTTESLKRSSSEANIMVTTEATKIFVSELKVNTTEAPKPSILTAEILHFIEEASTEGPTSSTSVSSFVEQNLDSISSSIMEETAESLVASSENKPTLPLKVESQPMVSKSAVIVVASCVSGIVLLAIIGLAYIVSFQRQTGTLDIEMQEQRCGKESYDDNEPEDESHERLLGTQEACSVTTADDIL